MKENYEIVAAIPDNTETYFITYGLWGRRIFRRTAILLVHDKNYLPGTIEKVFMDECGNIHDEMLDGPGPYGCDIFTVGIPVYLNNPVFLQRTSCPDEVIPILKKLKEKYGITFAKPIQNPFPVYISAKKEDKNFFLTNLDSNILGFNNFSGNLWMEEYAFNSPESLSRIGRWLGLFRYLFDMPELKYDLNFRFYIENTGKERWEEGQEEGFYETPYEEQRSFELENETEHKNTWEKEIHKAADEYYQKILNHGK